MDVMNRRVIIGEVEPAKSLYYMLCKDPKFKTNFLAHRDCLRHIEKVNIMLLLGWWFCVKELDVCQVDGEHIFNGKNDDKLTKLNNSNESNA